MSKLATVDALQQELWDELEKNDKDYDKDTMAEMLEYLVDNFSNYIISKFSDYFINKKWYIGSNSFYHIFSVTDVFIYGIREENKEEYLKPEKEEQIWDDGWLNVKL